MKVASTFSGCGGSSLGLKQAGLDVVWANEFIPAAADTYAANHPGTVLDRRDIRTISGRDISDSVGQVDLLEGSPPCAAFSLAGIMENGWKKQKKYSETTQRVDDLFDEWTRLVEELHPKVIVAENVVGLSKGVAKGYLACIVRRLEGYGYRMKVWKLDACRLGVAQSRARLVIVGVDAKLEGFPLIPTANERMTVRQAWEGLRTEVWAPISSAGRDMPSEK